MFLIEPFIWMFSVENFKKHFIYLLLVPVVCWVTVFLMFLCTNGFTIQNLVLNVVLIVLTIFVLLCPILCLTGYFWCLTDNIIGRNLEAKLNSVYNGKADFKNVITLPEWDIPRFIWRGIASWFASVIMYIPIVLVMVFIIFNMSLIASFWNLDPRQMIIAVSIIMIMISLLIPGLLWNYARRDSVVAVLNIPKAIYLMESYPLKYFLNSFLMVVFSIARSFIIRAIMIAIGMGAIFATNTAPNSYADFFNPSFITAYVVSIILGYILDSYWIFANSYLLGTIAPPSES